MKLTKQDNREYKSILSELISLIHYVWEHAIILLFIFSLCAAVTGGLFYRVNNDTESMSLTLNYEEAALGLAPNGEKIDLYALRSRNVMRRALELAGITDMEPEELANCVSVVSSNKNSGFSLGDKTSYIITTSYTISLKQDEALRRSRLTPRSMLLLIYKAYYQYFSERFIDDGIDLNLIGQIDGQQEFMEQWELINKCATQLRSYLSDRSDSAPAFTSSVTGKSFATLRQQTDNLIDVQLANCRAYLLQHGVARERAAYNSKLNYLNESLLKSRDKSKAAYKIRTRVIKEYDGEMISTVLIPTENSNRKFYMSKTETGIDYLAVDANNDAITQSTFQQMIDNNLNILEHLQIGRNNTSEEKTKAEQLLRKTSNTLNEILRVTLLTVDDYNQTESNDYVIRYLYRSGPMRLIGGKKFIAMCMVYAAVELFAAHRFMHRGKRNEKI